MMHFLARLSLRARPALSRAPALMPKGLAMRQPVPVFRAEQPPEEEEQAQPLRRAAARTIRRVEEPRAEEEKTQRSADPTAKEEDEREQPAMTRRVSGSLRRAENPEEEEPAQPLRRAAVPAPEPEEEKPAQAARLIRRAEEVPLEEGERPLRQPFQEDVSPGASPLPPDMANEEEPPAMQALRRDVAPSVPSPAATPTAADPGLAGFGAPRAGPSAENFGGGEVYMPAPPAGFDAPYPEVGASNASAPQRPQVIIDQVDVLIHEPVAPAAAARPAVDAGRALRARYLRRL